MTVEEAYTSGIISIEEYNKVIKHINEIDRILNKYNYLSRHFIITSEDECVNKNNNTGKNPLITKLYE